MPEDLQRHRAVVAKIAQHLQLVLELDRAGARRAKRQVIVGAAVVVAEMDVRQPVSQRKEIIARHAACGVDIAVADVEGQL